MVERKGWDGRVWDNLYRAMVSLIIGPGSLEERLLSAAPDIGTVFQPSVTIPDEYRGKVERLKERLEKAGPKRREGLIPGGVGAMTEEERREFALEVFSLFLDCDRGDPQ